MFTIITLKRVGYTIRAFQVDPNNPAKATALYERAVSKPDAIGVIVYDDNGDVYLQSAMIEAGRG